MPFNLAYFRKLFSLFRREFGHYWFSIFGVAILSFISAILEGVGINSIIPLFSFINQNAGKGTDTISQFISTFFAVVHLPFTLKTLLIFIVALFFVKTGVSFITTYLLAKINANYERNTRSVLFKVTLQAGWPYLSQQKIGHLEQILTTDVTNSSILLSYVSSTILIITNLVVYTGVAVNISPAVAALTVAAGVLIFLVFKPLFYRNKQASAKVEEVYKHLAHHVNEHVLGMKTIKAMAMEEPVKRQADGYFDRVKNLNVHIIFIRNITNALLQPIGLIFVIAIFSFFYKLTAFNFASFAVIVYAINKLFAYVQLAQSQLHAISSMTPYVESIERYRHATQMAKESESGTEAFSFERTLAFENVSFGYITKREIVSDLNLIIKKGEVVGIIGPSGAGKTTVVDLLLRLLQPLSGFITLDNKDINAIKLSDWRRHIGYVSQDMFLLNDTIENNIKFYDTSISDETMAASTAMANILDFIKQQPSGFRTVIGERGVLISGGEKQRIILARILARRPDILILDEATSALDNESEMLIQKAIEKLKGITTVIVIAHRLSTVRTADTLVALENGTIRERGRPDELLRDKNSYFFRVYNVG